MWYVIASAWVIFAVSILLDSNRNRFLYGSGRSLRQRRRQSRFIDE